LPLVQLLLNGKLLNVTDDNLLLTYEAFDVLDRPADKADRSRPPAESRHVLYRLSRRARLPGQGRAVIDFGVQERHDPVNKAVSFMKARVPRVGDAARRAGRNDPSTDARCVNLPDASQVTP
jgi:hypothetical protein